MLIKPRLESTLLSGQVAIVTGGSRGIGGASSEMLAANGAHVVVADVDEAAAHKAVDNICSAYGEGRASAFVGDLVASGTCEDLVDGAVEANGRLDIVVNNAGYVWDGGVHSMSDDQFQAMLDIHLIVPFRMARASAPHFREQAKTEDTKEVEGFRKFIMVSSMAAQWGLAGAANYASAKAGMLGLMRSLALEWGRIRVNSNAVAFGAVQTRFGLPQTDAETIKTGGREIRVGMTDKQAKQVGAEIDASKVWSDEEIYEPKRNRMVALGRHGTIREAAESIFWLASPLSDYVTGQVIPVSGGARGGLS